MCVCPLSPLAFMDQSAPNLAGRSGTHTENTSQDLFPWQPICCHSNPKKQRFYGQIKTVVTIHEVTLPVTSYVMSPWQCHNRNHLLWFLPTSRCKCNLLGNLRIPSIAGNVTFLSVCAVEGQLGTPLAVC